jgi:hypothetical protein
MVCALSLDSMPLPVPTTDELERAAATVAAIARIDSLRGGVVVFEAQGLAGGRWYEPDDRPGGLELVWVPVLAGDDLEELSRSLVRDAIDARQRELEAQAFAHADDGDHEAAGWALSLMYAA